MRLGAAFLLWASIVPATLAIFADEAGQIDYHHALLGTPRAHSTFFHRPSSSSSASLLYTLSEKFILGAVNPKDGSAVWRQNLSDYSAAASSNAFLRATDGHDTVVSALGNGVSSWGAADGKLSWTTTFTEGQVHDLEVIEPLDGNLEGLSPDPVVLVGGDKATVKRIDGKTGSLKWEYKDSGYVFYIVLPLQLLIYVRALLTFVFCTETIFPSKFQFLQAQCTTSPCNLRPGKGTRFEWLGSI